MKDKLEKLSTEIGNVLDSGNISDTIKYLNLWEIKLELDKILEETKNTVQIVTDGNSFHTNCLYCLYEDGKDCNNALSKYYKKEIEYDFLCKEFYSYLVLEGKEEAVLEDFNKFEVLEL